MKVISKFAVLTLLIVVSCQTRNNVNMKTTNNPLLCNPSDGICEMPVNSITNNHTEPYSEKAIKIIYFTDPICSSCWGIEPQLRKLKLEYPNIEIEYRMGGLLPDWSYNSGGISKPSDVAHHWDEVSKYYEMPIDGDVWLENPLHSSYPPSIAYKAAQLQDAKKALLFLREIREMVFLKKKNITSWGNLEFAASKVGLDTSILKEDYEGKAKLLFEKDLALAKSMGVRGFPTLYIVSDSTQPEVIYGSKPYSHYEAAFLKIKNSQRKVDYKKDWRSLFSYYTSLTAKEFSILSETSKTESESLLNELTAYNYLTEFKTKNGSIWMMK